MELLTGINDHGRRLDRILRKALPECPLPLIHRLIRKGLILVNGRPAGAQTRVAKGSRIHIPRLASKKIAKKEVIKPKLCASVPLCEDIKKEKKLNVRFYRPPDVLWQNQNIGLLAFNKPAGLAVHGQVSLDRMVQAYLTNKIPASLSFKPGPLHRLDKPTSGIVMFSSSLEGANLFSSLMKEQKVKKTYMAIVEGAIKDKRFLTNYLVRDKEKKKSFITENEGRDKKGKIAITMIVPLATAKIKDKTYTLIEAEIETGRTHQIRAQAAYYGYPLAGDRKYGGNNFSNNPDSSFFLHAWKMEFPINNEQIKIEAPLPSLFKKIVTQYFKYTM